MREKILLGFAELSKENNNKLIENAKMGQNSEARVYYLIGTTTASMRSQLGF